ncbi:hypothetical protein QTP88_008166 [Uroleucon formosanum]
MRSVIGRQSSLVVVICWAPVLTDTQIVEHSNILKELVRAKESIKRKYITLKTGKANVQQLMAQTFKPIINPLTKISNTHDLYNNQTRKEDVKIDSEIININEGNNYDNYQLEIENWFQSKDIDKTFGPKKIANDEIILGDKEVKFAQNVIIIDETTYPATSGLIQLLFLKNPLVYTDNDLKIYKSILIQTSSHLTAGGLKIRNTTCKKYKNIISKLFPTVDGSGLSMQLQKNNLVYWDYPNELVDRLRLLIASKSAVDLYTRSRLLVLTLTMSSSSAIVDIQCVLGINNKYMIKKMSAVDTETWATQHWIFKNSNSKQDNKSRKTNKWLERNYHQLPLEYGDIEYEELGRILNSLKSDCIYVKGEQKKQLLMEHIPHVALVNIEDLGCPRLDQICGGGDVTLPCFITIGTLVDFNNLLSLSAIVTKEVTKSLATVFCDSDPRKITGVWGILYRSRSSSGMSSDAFTRNP